MDKWKHRSEGMRCVTCMWYCEKQVDDATVQVVGRCRRHAPTMNGYPVVYPGDWCGDHKLNEKALGAGPDSTPCMKYNGGALGVPEATEFAPIEKRR